MEFKNHILTDLSADLTEMSTLFDDNQQCDLLGRCINGPRVCLLAAKIVEKFIKMKEKQIDYMVEMEMFQMGFGWTKMKGKIMREEFWACLKLELE